MERKFDDCDNCGMLRDLTELTKDGVGMGVYMCDCCLGKNLPTEIHRDRGWKKVNWWNETVKWEDDEEDNSHIRAVQKGFEVTCHATEQERKRAKKAICATLLNPMPCRGSGSMGHWCGKCRFGKIEYG